MILLVIILLVLILLINYFVASKFTYDYECAENKRLFPEGKIPGEYLGVNKYTEDELTKKFNQNGDVLINKYVKFKVSP